MDILHKSVLLVEDDTMIGENIKIGLELEGGSVEWLMDGQCASSTLATSSFDAVILDIGLPGKTGLDLLRELRARDDRTPVLMVTALDSSGIRDQCLACGADVFLKKPFDLDDLILELQGIFGKKPTGEYLYGVLRRTKKADGGASYEDLDSGPA
jgi:DNA-binding response OmpR family regulator